MVRMRDWTPDGARSRDRLDHAFGTALMSAPSLAVCTTDPPRLLVMESDAAQVPCLGATRAIRRRRRRCAAATCGGLFRVRQAEPWDRPALDTELDRAVFDAEELSNFPSLSVPGNAAID